MDLRAAQRPRGGLGPSREHHVRRPVSVASSPRGPPIELRASKGPRPRRSRTLGLKSLKLALAADRTEMQWTCPPGGDVGCCAGIWGLCQGPQVPTAASKNNGSTSLSHRPSRFGSLGARFEPKLSKLVRIQAKLAESGPNLADTSRPKLAKFGPSLRPKSPAYGRTRPMLVQVSQIWAEFAKYCTHLTGSGANLAQLGPLWRPTVAERAGPNLVCAQLWPNRAPIGPNRAQFR